MKGKSVRQPWALPCAWALLCQLLVPVLGIAVQTDIPGPPGSVYFGTAVSVLPNGNIVVTDPLANVGAVATAGAVYLFSPAGNLISTLSGSSTGDRVGSDGLVVLPSGNFVVISTQWNNAGVASVGAVTWVDGEVGLDAAVSVANSLVGTTANDRVGSSGLAVLANGNYVVRSPEWHNGGVISAGAATWGNGNSGVAGAVSPANSLVGTNPYEYMGSFNSIAVLPDGNYVLADGGWSDGAKATVGAVVWLDGEVGLSGTISAANALIGSTAGDAVGAAGVTALSNGNYVVASPNWSNGSTRAVGAVTWIDAKGTKSGVVASFNSLTGKTENDQVGLGGLEGYWMHGVYALSNGNYVVASPQWNNGLLAGAGAVTWCNGKTGRTGRVSTSNSLVGTSKNDHVGSHGVFALSNGNYVLASAYWQNGKGATTWADGTALLTGTISSANSLVGSTGGDFHDGVGEAAVVALSNGNYVVPIPFWSNQATDYGIGAAKWGNGSAGTSGVVSAADALTGDVGYEFVGTFVAAIGDGNYVAVSPGWTEAESGAWQAGAVRRSFGGIGIVGKNSRLNAFTGQQTLDGIGWGGVVVFVDGNYAILSPRWQDASGTCGGAVTLISASAKPSGSPQPYNSVTCAGSVSQSAVGYDPMRKRIAVGRPGQQSVSLLTLDQVFDDNLE